MPKTNKIPHLTRLNNFSLLTNYATIRAIHANEIQSLEFIANQKFHYPAYIVFYDNSTLSDAESHPFLICEVVECLMSDVPLSSDILVRIRFKAVLRSDYYLFHFSFSDFAFLKDLSFFPDPAES